MVCTEADMIVNHINHHHIDHYHIDHHHIIHHQSILYNILNLVNFSTRRNCKISSINTIISKMIMKMKGWSMEGLGGSLILTLTREVNCLTLEGETGFLILFITEEDVTQMLMSLGSLLLIEILILSHPCFGFKKLVS